MALALVLLNARRVRQVGHTNGSNEPRSIRTDEEEDIRFMTPEGTLSEAGRYARSKIPSCFRTPTYEHLDKLHGIGIAAGPVFWVRWSRRQHP